MSDKGYKADKVVFTCHNPNIILDCNSYMNSLRYKAPFDEDELICYLENPKVIKISGRKGSFWYVDAIE